MNAKNIQEILTERNARFVIIPINGWRSAPVLTKLPNIHL